MQIAKQNQDAGSGTDVVNRGGRVRLMPGLIAMLLFAGCAYHVRESPPAIDAPQAFSRPGEAALPARWWEAFEDQALNTHIAEALDANFSLVAAWERLVSARALAVREGAARAVSVDGVAGARYETHSDDGTSRRLSAGLEASYELDLWGSIRSRAEAEQLRASAALAAYQAAALTLSAEVALTWYDWAEARSQLALLQEQIKTNETVLELLQSRFRSGLIRSADVLRQRQLLEATREQEAVVRARIGIARHRLAVLKGLPPQSLPGLGVEGGLPALPPLPRTGLPAELIERRPDVREAYLEVEAADRDLAAAISERYPRIDLSVSLGTVAEHAGDLFSDWLASVVGDLVAPLTDGGRLSAEADRAAADYGERVATYRQTVLDAYRDVEDALVREAYQLERVQRLENQAQLAKQTYGQLRLQYLNGVSDYLDVLAALTDSQRLDRELSAARLELLEYRIALYRALAGDFDGDRDGDGDGRYQSTDKGDSNHG